MKTDGSILESRQLVYASLTGAFIKAIDNDVGDVILNLFTSSSWRMIKLDLTTPSNSLIMTSNNAVASGKRIFDIDP